MFLVMLKGGYNKFWGTVLSTREFEALASLIAGAKSFYPLIGRCDKFYPVLRRGVTSIFRPVIL